MSNPILQSESFDRAAYAFRSACDELRTTQGWFSENATTISNAATTFADAVNKLAKIEGMKAENAQRAHLGQAMAYVEKDFENV